MTEKKGSKKKLTEERNELDMLVRSYSNLLGLEATLKEHTREIRELIKEIRQIAILIRASSVNNSKPLNELENINKYKSEEYAILKGQVERLEKAVIILECYAFSTGGS